jgi:hypothetical protein
LETPLYIPANEAKEIDFMPNIIKKESDEIFPVAKSHFFQSINLEVTSLEAATQALTDIAASANALAEATKSVFETDFREGDKSELMLAAQRQLQHFPMQPDQLLRPIKFNELTANSVLVDVLSAKAESLGCIVTTNSSGCSSNKTSKYYRSKPDLVIYKEDCAYVVIKDAPASDETSEESTDETTTHTIGVTENTVKVKASGDIVGQLLGGMDKVAGELAYEHLRNGELPIEIRLFRQIKVYGLIIDLEGGKSRPYMLNMDFVTKCSVVYRGRQELDLVASINRLLSCLDCK